MASQLEHQLASSERLSRLFYKGFSVVDLAEPLYSFDDSTPCSEVAMVMDSDSLLVVGVRHKGRVVGYVEVGELNDIEDLSTYHSFQAEELLNDTANLQQLIERLAVQKYVFIQVLGTVTGVISSEDLEKPAMRMWLFGTISLIEMNIALAVKYLYPDDQWQNKISPGRLAKAQDLQSERKRRGQGSQLLDCLQFSDKLRILIQDEQYRAQLLPNQSRRGAERFLKQLESLRNNLAHSQPIIEHNWDAIQFLAASMENIIKAERLRSLISEAKPMLSEDNL